MVKVKGATVYPSEVEAALRAVVDVQQAHVIDVASAEGQREIAALVISEADLATIRDSVRSRLSAFKVPTRWLITSRDVAPLLASGKVDKAALQTLLESEGSSGP
jgi:acyl-CoA synthetase (AMP-forming)/AMP-acid ligase II